MKACRLKVGDKVIIREEYRAYLRQGFNNNEILTITRINENPDAQGGYSVSASTKSKDVRGHSIDYFLLYSKIVAEFNKI